MLIDVARLNCITHIQGIAGRIDVFFRMKEDEKQVLIKSYNLEIERKDIKEEHKGHTYTGQG